MNTIILFTIIFLLIIVIRIATHKDSFKDIGNAIVSSMFIILLIVAIVTELQSLFPQLK